MSDPRFQLVVAADMLVSCSNKAKSVTITGEGLYNAELFLQALGLEHLLHD